MYDGENTATSGGPPLNLSYMNPLDIIDFAVRQFEETRHEERSILSSAFIIACQTNIESKSEFQL